jgi:hypothetical protein
MKPIGGYFELETSAGREYHSGLLKLNTGRNGLEYILRVRKYTKVYIPYYTCDVILEPFKKLNIEHAFYHIDEQLDPILDFKINENEALLYTNYFGLKGPTVERLAGEGHNLIIDNAQAFYDPPLKGIDTFYSPRKFFGVPDGAYVSIDKTLNEDFKQDSSIDRFSHLLKRVELGAEAGYADFRQNDKDLEGQPIKRMSSLTQKLLASLDYGTIAKKRKENFQIMHNGLAPQNKLAVDLHPGAVPMVYPLFVPKPGLRDFLIQNRIFVATYWPNVPDWTTKGQWENKLVQNLIALPIDQRYNSADMQRIIQLIGQYK